jgi:membrane-associated protease RseP (regulator of RpoE activity)
MSRNILPLAFALALAPFVSFASDPPKDAAAGGAPEVEKAAAIDDFVAKRLTRISLVNGESDARRAALDFLGSDQAHRDAYTSLQQCRSCHGADRAAWTRDAAALARLQPQGPWVGISVGPADGVLRSQLRLPDGTGVVVTQVVPNGPAQQAGVEEHDVLLSVNDKPVSSGDDLDKILQSASPDGPPLRLKLLRRGQALEKQVTPRKSDTAEWLSTVLVGPPASCRIGIQVSDPDETLKKQLGLENRGVVVTEVAGDKPADAAGVKSGDVLLSINGNPVAHHDELPEKIQAAGGSPVELELMRGGVTLKIAVTPVKESVTDAAAAYLDYARVQPQMRELMMVQPHFVDVLADASHKVAEVATPQPADASPAQRLQQIISQIEQLQKEVAALQGQLDKKEAKPKE